ncbi:hypothetical protein F4823DRAFT_567496 [Ustulina deusta]|nr:hypothetical protein F4823DRAFT_567496 [Ustulina deusta]
MSMAALDGSLSGTAAAAQPTESGRSLLHPVRSFTILGVFVSLSLLAVVVRIYVRFRFTKSWGWDDYTCIMATIGSLSYAILYSVGNKVFTKDALNDVPDISILAFNDELKAQLLSVNGTSYQIAIFLTKLSILLLYLRLFSVNKLFAFFVITSIVIVTIFYIPLIGVGIGFLVTCNDVMNLDSPLCIQSWSMLLLNASLNVITDLWLLLLPFPLVMKLRLQPRKKACAASLARLIVIVVDRDGEELSWITVAEFSIAEINIGIIVACVSSFPVFFDQVRDWLRLTGSSKPTQVQSPESDVGQTV